MRRLCALAALSLAFAGRGHVEFLRASQELVEGNSIHFVGLVRRNGTEGELSANISVLPSNATDGRDFLLTQRQVTFQDGDQEPKALVLRLLNDNVSEKLLTLRLAVSSSMGTYETLIRIRDDNDGGFLRLRSKIGYVEETLLLDEPDGGGDCLILAERVGGSSGRAILLVNWYIESCAGDARWPAVSAQAISAVDAGFYNGTVTWEDGDSEPRCAVRQSHLKQLPGSTPAWMRVYPDGLVEKDEGACGFIAAGAGSTAKVEFGIAYFSVIIKDAGKFGGGQLSCVKGANCSIDLSKSVAHHIETVFNLSKSFRNLFLQAAGHGANCLPCAIGLNHASHQNLSLRQFVASGESYEAAAADFGLDLAADEPGDRSICGCTGNSSYPRAYHLSTLTLKGPFHDNAAGCLMSQRSCRVFLRAVGLEVSRDFLRIMPSCGDVRLTPPGFVAGAVAVAEEGGFYQMLDPGQMRTEEAGLYQLCWCHQSGAKACDGLEDFDVFAGAFFYMGPYLIPGRQVRLLESFQVEVAGIGLSQEDRAMLLPRCGSSGGLGGSAAQVTGRFFRFGQLQNMAAGEYQLCWCQPKLEVTCEESGDFTVAFGNVSVLCPQHHAKTTSGDCLPCWFLFERIGANDQCQVDGLRFGVVLFWFSESFLLCMACLASLRCSRGRLRGRPRCIEDISQAGGRLIITTNGYHNLITFPVPHLRSIPVTITNSGHYLDGRQFRILVRSNRMLELVDEQEQPLDVRMDTSMGEVNVSLVRALAHSSLRGVKVPLLAQILGVVALFVACLLYLDPPWSQSVMVICGGASLALLFFLCWLQLMRTSTPIRNSLALYAKILAEKNPKPWPCERGPSRAVTVEELLSLWDHFSSFIRDRDMYYVDANVTRQLCAPSRLSYAELVGPRPVQWFVSHWWGTKMRVYCEALQRHAKAVAVASDAEWKATTYWICTFSNNQYQLHDELGSSHEESSFYLALHSGICRGTCMVLDEQAMPLKRSWCLFELLQTINLEKSQLGFKGLLFCTETGVLNFGAATVEMSWRLGARLASLSLQDAEATTEEDKNMIRSLVLKEMESFDRIDQVLKHHIGAALTVCHKCVHQTFGEIYEKLGFRNWQRSPSAIVL